MDRPDDARYTETHEWLKVDGETVTMGVTDFAIEHLGDLVFVDFTDSGTDVSKGDTVCEIESVKAVGEVYAPLDGSISETNSEIADDLDTLAKDPYGDGWLVKLKASDTSALDSLMDKAAYEKYLETAEPS